MKSLPKLSIVIPVKNGMDTLPNLINGIQDQTRFEDCEVVVLDSGSTDGSVEYLQQFEFVTIVPIDPKTFNHGATRNLGVTHAKGDLVLLTVQDASPTSENWLQNFMEHFNDDEVMGVCGQQIVPHDKDKNPHEWFRPQSEPVPQIFQYKKPEDFLALSGLRKRQVCGWDDVNAMYRKTALQELPFEPLMFGEDMLWARMALERGFKLVYDYNIRVNHYHYQFPEFTYKRVLISKLFTYKCLNYIDDRKPLIKNYALVVYRNMKWKLPIQWIWHNFKIIYNHRKANAAFLVHLQNDTLGILEKELALNIPMGLQNNKK